MSEYYCGDCGEPKEGNEPDCGRRRVTMRLGIVFPVLRLALAVFLHKYDLYRWRGYSRRDAVRKAWWHVT